MADTYYPDISAFQGAIPLTGASAVCIKATEGTGWADPDYAGALSRAASAGAWPFLYHFLHQGNAAAQAAWCHAHAGRMPLMLDWEPTGTSAPGVTDAEAFTDAYRAAGGTISLVYFPRWYWGQLGSPALGGIAGRKLSLVSSDYTPYSDTGPGWDSYGGMTPVIWQYTDAQQFGGQRVDFNAYRGTLTQLKELVSGGTPPPPTLTEGATGPDVVLAQERLNIWGAHPQLTVDGVFGKATLAATQAFQHAHGLTADGIIGPLTWAALDASPAPPPPPPPPPPPHHGQYVADGTHSLAGIGNLLGQAPATLLRMTAVHYGAYDPKMYAYLNGLAIGTVQPTAPVPAGAVLWVN